jgi:hypothetical protein
MKEVELVTAFFKAIETGDASKIVSLFDDFAIVNDPVIGELRGQQAKHVYSFLAINIHSVKIDLTFSYIDPFRASIKWQVISTLKSTKRRVHCTGLMNMEFMDKKIHRISNDHSLLRLLGSIKGKQGFLLGLLPFYRKRFRAKLIHGVEDYIQFRKTIIR